MNKTKRWVVYKVTRSETGDFYIGSTGRVKPHKRWNDHKSSCKDLNNRWHFYNALRKYGTEAFVFEVIEEFPDERSMSDREMELIDLLKPYYNSTKGGERNSPIYETRQKLSNSLKTSPKAIAQRARMWEKRWQNCPPEEWSKIMSDAQASMSPEALAQKSKKLSEAQAARTPEQEAERQRRRAETIANRTEEEKAQVSSNLSAGIKARVLSEEAQAKIAEGQVQGGHLAGALMKARLQVMPHEEKEARMNNIVAGIKKAAASRTQEQRDEITRKRLESRARNKAAKEQAALETQTK